jgi:hypothetical protein
MYVEGISSFDMAATKESLAFLKQKIVSIRGQYRFFGSIVNGLFDDLGFEGIPADSS